MKVKGIGIKLIREFVKTKFGERYNDWVNALPEQSQWYYKNGINVSELYPIKEAYLTPIDKVVEMFYNGDYKKCGEEMGFFGAELAFKGIYKAFLLVTSPNFLMVRAAKIISSYYDCGAIFVSAKGNKTVSLRIINFPVITSVMEYKVIGWCKRALELCNCKNVKYQLTAYLTRNDTYTEIVFVWD